MGRAAASILLAMHTVVFARGVRAELPAPNDAAPPLAEGPREATATSPQAVAKIVLVGSLALDRELSLLIEELLDRGAIRAEITRAERLEPNALFVASGRDTLVLLTLTDPHQARLQFRGPNGQRYLLRKLTLPGGLDGVGRELTAQVIESSVVALVRTNEGLSRSEAARELGRESPAVAAPQAEPAPRAVASLAPPRSAQIAWQPRLGLRYAARWSGAELGLAHGPGVVFGARLRHGGLFGAELGIERLFAQTLSRSALSAEVQVTAAHALFELGWRLGRRQGLWLAVGPALQLSRVSPLSGATGVALAPRRLDTVPACRGELRYELAGDHFSLGAAAALDVWLVRLHYELAGAKATEELASPNVVRPGAVLWLAVGN